MPRRKKTVTKLPALRETYDERSLYPWMDIRSEYIEGIQDEDGTWIWPSYRQLALKHDMPEKPLQNRATKERWTDHRRAHQNQVAIERQKEHSRLLAKKAVKFDEQTVENAFMAQDLIRQRLEELAELQEHVIKNRQHLIEAIEAGEPVRVSELKASAFSGSELESLAKAAALFQETGRKGLGLKDGDVSIVQTNIDVRQTDIRTDMVSDPERIKSMLKVLGNPNFSMPALAQSMEEDIVDAEVEDDDGSTTD